MKASDFVSSRFTLSVPWPHPTNLEDPTPQFSGVGTSRRGERSRKKAERRSWLISVACQALCPVSWLISGLFDL